MSFPLSALAGGPVGFTIDITDIKYIDDQRVLLYLPDRVHNFLQSVRFFWGMSDCTVIFVKTFLDCCQRIKPAWPYKGSTGSYS